VTKPKISKIHITTIFLFAIALILTFTAITIHTINAQTAELLWGTPHGGLADSERYLQIEWIVRTFSIGAIILFSVSAGLICVIFIELFLSKKASLKND